MTGSSRINYATINRLTGGQRSGRRQQRRVWRRQRRGRSRRSPAWIDASPHPAGPRRCRRPADRRSTRRSRHPGDHPGRGHWFRLLLQPLRQQGAAVPDGLGGSTGPLGPDARPRVRGSEDPGEVFALSLRVSARLAWTRPRPAPHLRPGVIGRSWSPARSGTALNREVWGVSLVDIGPGRHGIAARADGLDQMWIRSTRLLN